jgi:hypothetical protein
MADVMFVSDMWRSLILLLHVNQCDKDSQRVVDELLPTDTENELEFFNAIY